MERTWTEKLAKLEKERGAPSTIPASARAHDETIPLPSFFISIGKSGEGARCPLHSLVVKLEKPRSV